MIFDPLVVHNYYDDDYIADNEIARLTEVVSVPAKTCLIEKCIFNETHIEQIREHSRKILQGADKICAFVETILLNNQKKTEEYLVRLEPVIMNKLRMNIELGVEALQSFIKKGQRGMSLDRALMYTELAMKCFLYCSPTTQHSITAMPVGILKAQLKDNAYYDEYEDQMLAIHLKRVFEEEAMNDLRAQFRTLQQRKIELFKNDLDRVRTTGFAEFETQDWFKCLQEGCRCLKKYRFLKLAPNNNEAGRCLMEFEQYVFEKIELVKGIFRKECPHIGHTVPLAACVFLGAMMQDELTEASYATVKKSLAFLEEFHPNDTESDEALLLLYKMVHENFKAVRSGFADRLLCFFEFNDFVIQSGIREVRAKPLVNEGERKRIVPPRAHYPHISSYFPTSSVTLASNATRTLYNSMAGWINWATTQTSLPNDPEMEDLGGTQ